MTRLNFFLCWLAIVAVIGGTLYIVLFQPAH